MRVRLGSDAFELLATIIPNSNKRKRHSGDDWVERLAGSMSNGIVADDLDAAIRQAYHDEMMKKYGHMNAE